MYIVTDTEKYLNGNCNIFAVALSKITNMKIGVFIEDRVCNYKVYDGLVHAFCFNGTLSDDSFVVDAAGSRPLKEIINEYNITENIRFKIVTSDEVLDFGYTTTDTLEEAIRKAKKYIFENIL